MDAVVLKGGDPQAGSELHPASNQDMNGEGLSASSLERTEFSGAEATKADDPTLATQPGTSAIGAPPKVVDQAKASILPNRNAGVQSEAKKKGTSLQSTLDAGAQAFGSVRAVVAKNLASLQATRDTERKSSRDKGSAVELAGEPSAFAGKNATKKGADLGDSVPSTGASSLSASPASGTKQSFGSGISLASLGSRLQSLRQTAVKAVSQPVRHLVSQNKRRYMDGEYDLDLSYITENIIAMGFPAGDLSSGLFGYVEGFYRNHMEEVVRFLDAHHKGKCKVFNLCSERLYDSSLFEGLVACFPFDDHNCPPLPLLKSFCDSAYDWLKQDMDHMVVVHCKAGKSRTGLMICCLLLYLKLFDSAEEAIKFYNTKRCTDNQGLTLPSQIRYVRYFEHILNNGGETPQPEARVLRGIRLHKCPYWIRPSITVLDHNGVIFSTKKHPRTKDLAADDLWHKAPRKGVVVFALPGERCVADLKGDFKVLFHDRHGDFYCWLNTAMIGTRQFLETKELDWFDRRRLPSPGFQVEVVVLDPATQAARSESGATTTPSSGPEVRMADSQAASESSDGGERKTSGDRASTVASGQGSGKGARLKTTKEREEDEVFGESDEETEKPSRPREEVSSADQWDLPQTSDTKQTKQSADGPVQSIGEPLPGKTQAAGARARSDQSAKPSNAGITQPTLGARSQPPTAGSKDETAVTSTTSQAVLAASGLQIESGAKELVKEAAVNAEIVETLEGEEKGEQKSTRNAVELASPNVEAPSTSAPPAEASVQPPSGASALFADDWEADIFGSEDTKTIEGLGSKVGALNLRTSQVNLGPAALSSDFARMAVAGSADASEFSLGDDDDFDSDDGF